MTPTQRSLCKLRADGWLVAVVERWNPYARVRQDLFGFADLLAIKGNEVLAVQTTSGDHVAHRLQGTDHSLEQVAAGTLGECSPAVPATILTLTGCLTAATVCRNRCQRPNPAPYGVAPWNGCSARS